MADELTNIPDDQTLEHHLVLLFEKLETIKKDELNNQYNSKLSVQIEIRTLEFWRSVMSECLASFIYVFVVCGAAAGASAGASMPSVLLATALSAGFATTSLTQCFGHISGAHINPAVTVAMGLTKKISLLRTSMFVIAQCGGAIAGAAFLYGVTSPGYQGGLIQDAPWEKFAVEFVLTFVVVFAYFVSMQGPRKWMGTSSLTIGATYSACSFVSVPYLNPARSLGPCFVFNKWDNHWVYWLGPVIGGCTAGLVYEYIFNSKRNKLKRESTEGDSSSIHSDEDTYDNLDKPVPPKFHGSTYNTYRSTGANAVPSGYCASLTSASLYSAPVTKLERVESLYGGTKSLYCKSPPLTRANLNRSQSVYTKSNTGAVRDILPKPGPLVPAQSLYPMLLNQQSHVQTQNLQNQLQQRSESIYGVRGITPGTTRSDTYSTTTERTVYNAKNSQTGNDNGKYEENLKGRRPESMYGMLSSQRRGVHSAQSEDSSYASYAPSTRNNTNSTNVTYQNNQNYQIKSGNSTFVGRNVNNGQDNNNRPTPPPPTTTTTTSHHSATTSSSYHHNMPQNSPNSQY